MNHVVTRLICLSSVVAAGKMLNLYEGDNCTLADGLTKGICRDHSACPYLKSIPKKDWVTCSFHRPAGAGSEESPIICCRENAGHLTKRSAPESAPRVDQDREECGNLTGVTDHIFGGSNAYYEDFPYIAALKYANGTNPFRCGATLISRRFLLTAAHCLIPDIPEFARVGVANITHGDTLVDRPIDVAIVECIRHPNYTRNKIDKSIENDIALLRLERNMDDDFIKLPCLYNETTDPTPNEVLKIAGWGTADDSEQQTSPPLLQYANVTVVDRRDCELPKRRRKISDTQLCAIGRDADGNTTSDSCKGDSGGPLELIMNQKRYVVGITSSGIPCGSNSPGIYTRVSSYVSWIESIVWPD